LGLAYVQARFPDQAHAEWQQAARLQPRLAAAQEALARLGLQRNDLDEAEKSAEAMIAAQPAFPMGYDFLAVAKARRGDFPGAESELKKAIELAPHDPIAYTRMGELRMIQKKYPEAEKLFNQALDIDPAFTESLAGLLRLYESQKKPPDFITQRIQEQIDRAPKHSPYYLMLGQVLYGHQHFDKAQAAFAKAVDLDHNNLSAFIMLAETQAALGSLPQAVASAQLAVQQNPHDVRSYALWGLLEEKSGNWQKAEEAYRRALQIDSGYVLVASNLAFLLLDHGGNVDYALSLAQTARNAVPDSPTTADTLAWAYVMKGVYGSAVDLLEKAVAQTPENPTYRFHLAVAYLRMGNSAAAASQFHQILKMDPRYDKADEIRQYLADMGKG
jgi:Flp pilus assembly protein TadD